MYACGTGGMATCIAYLNKHNLMGSHTFKLVWKHGITTAKITRTGKFTNADGTVILTMSPSVRLVTEGGGGGSKINNILLTQYVNAPLKQLNLISHLKEV